MQPTPADPASQSPWQWAMRVHAVLLFALLLGSVPLFHLVWHGLLGREQPAIPVRDQTRSPVPTLAKLRTGSYAEALGQHLRAASPVVWWLRGNWNEAMLALDLPSSAKVHVGRDGWLFLREDVTPDLRRLTEMAAARQRGLLAVRDRLRQLGVELIISLVPNKSRVHSERRRSPLPPTPVYGELLGELRQLGLEVVDVAAAMAAVLAAEPERQLYFRGDSHWLPSGALIAGQAIAAQVEAGSLAARLSPRLPVQLGSRTTFFALGDLVAMLGILTADLPSDAGRRLTVGLSMQAHSLRELREYYSVAPLDQALAARFAGQDPAAEVVLVGTSFANENGLPALMLALGRPVRMVQENGAASVVPMQRLLQELAEPGAILPQLVVWEIVERGFFEPVWRDPPF